MMIGPRHGQTPCPWCDGSGEDHEQRWREWEGEAATGRYVTRVRVVACDGCGGRGRVTRQAARQMQAPCPYCGEEACERSCTGAVLADDPGEDGA